MAEKRKTATGVLIGAAGTLIVLAIVGLIVIYGGLYNVAATDGHAPLVRWAINTSLHNSVSSRAEGLTPPRFTQADLRQGLEEFSEYCVHCHGAPGVKPAEWVSGMSPNPPSLSRAAEEWNTAELFWIVKHGIKMTGMPPFGPGHDDRTIWNIAAFVEQLPSMTAEEYRALGGGAGHRH